METLFRWIHLSDIHFGHGDAAHGWDQKLILSSLQKDIGAMRRKDPAPIDAILVTGDIAFSGNGRRATEYDDARARLLGFAAEAGVTARQIFTVPGNHDINRGGDRDRRVARLLEGLREGRDPLDSALGDAADRLVLTQRMSAYLDFAKAFAPACLEDDIKPPEQRLYWSHRFTTAKGLPVRLVGLNSSLLCADEQDKGKLHLGKEQLVQALVEPPVDLTKELVMVLTHHPLRAGWLAPDDDREMDAWIRNHAQVHLAGHVHEADSEQTRSGAGGAFVRIVAGAAHGEAEPHGVPAAHGYSFGALVREGGKARLRIWPRKWSPKSVSFRIDQDNVPDGQDYAEHDLPKLALPAPPASAVTPGEPIPIFVSYVPEDEAYFKKLTTHLAGLRRKGAIRLEGRAIDPGESWRGAVDERMAKAKLILLLISPEYLASDYCFDIEMQAAKSKREAGEAKVIPILVRPSDFAHAGDTSNNQRAQNPAWFEEIAALPHVGPTGSKAVSEWGPGDAVDVPFKAIAEEIRLLVEKMRGERPER